MIVFVTGATGAIGRATVPALIARGHIVRGLSASPERDDRLRAMEMEPIRANLADKTSLRSALAEAGAVVHLASKIPAPPTRQP